MVKFNNIDLASKGIIVEQIPKIIKGKKRIETYQVEGRNGVLVVDKGTYDTFVVSLSCHFNEKNYSIDEIKELLDGYGKLSLDGLREYDAFIQNQIDFDEVERSGFRKFPIQFMCNPIAHDINSTSVEITESGTDIEIEQTANSYPMIELTGENDISITINNKTFYLYDLDNTRTYTLDCNSKEIYDDLGNNCSNQMSGDFPYLIPNTNTVSYTGTINSLEIEYKKAYL